MKVVGLFIGIDTYSDGRLANLTWPSRDAENLRDALIEVPAGLAASNSTVVSPDTDGLIKRRDIVNAVSRFTALINEGDEAFFHFSGHGFWSEFGAAAGNYIAPSDAFRRTTGQLEPESAVSLNYIIRELTRNKPAHLLVVLDACRIDIDDLATRSADPEPDRRIDLDSGILDSTGASPVTIFSATGLGEAAYEGPEFEGGLFSACLADAIRDLAKQIGAPPLESVVTTAQLFEGAKNRVQRALSARPDLSQVPSKKHLNLDTSWPVLRATFGVFADPVYALRQEVINAEPRVRRLIGEFEPCRRTPLKRARRLERKYNCRRLYFKLECLQNTSSFKYRGAMNAVEILVENGFRGAVFTASAGNHGLGLAVAASHQSVPCHIYMPETTPQTKVDAVLAYTKDVVLKGKNYDECQQFAQDAAAKARAEYIHAFNDLRVAAGQGTIAQELIDDWRTECEAYSESNNGEELGGPDYVIIPCGGGGLLAGIGSVLCEKWPDTKLIAVEPDTIPSLTEALLTGEPKVVADGYTLADGVAVKAIGDKVLPVLLRIMPKENVWRVSENNIASAILSLIEDVRVLTEGAGAISLAGLIQSAGPQRDGFANKKVICLVSGGNLDITALAHLVNKGLFAQGRRVRFRITVPDRPGNLAKVTSTIAETSASVIDLDHQRYSGSIGLGEALVDVTLETSNEEHATIVYDHLLNAGFKVEKVN